MIFSKFRERRKIFQGLTFLGMGAGVLLVLGLAGIGFLVYSSSPGFCRNCHIMEPYYLSWERSPHNNVTCTKCHFEPGLEGTIRGKWQASALVVKYLTHTYSPKPFAHISDASCLQEGCHIKEKLGKITKPFLGKASFDHQAHFKEGLQTNLTCTACHSPLKRGEHISVNEQHCYLCHLNRMDAQEGREEKDDGECRRCHEGMPDIIEKGKRNIDHKLYVERNISCYQCHLGIVKGDGGVKESTCYNCHNFEERIEIRKEKVKLHKIHVGEHVECFLCHDDIIHRKAHAETVTAKECRNCHSLRHAGVTNLYTGTGGMGVPDRPSPMYAAGVDCIGCHVDTESTTETGDPHLSKKISDVKRRCITCHKDQQYGKVLDTWRTSIRTKLAGVERKFAKAKAKNGGLNDRRDLEEARFNIGLVTKSPGIHNVGYTLELLDYAEARLNHLLGLKTVEQPKGETDDGIIWYTDTEGLGPVPFDHVLHQTLVDDCEDCHDGLFDMEAGSADAEGRLSMSNMARGQYCGNCHNGDLATSIKDDCTYCHKDKEPAQAKPGN